MNAAMQRDLGSFVHPKYSHTSTLETEVDGAYVEIPISEGFWLSVSWAVAGFIDDETLSLAVNFQDATSIAGAGVADVKATTALGAVPADGKFTLSGVIYTAPAAGAPHVANGVATIRFPGGRRNTRAFIRAQTTAVTSQVGVSTVAYTATYHFHGLDENPAVDLPSFVTLTP